MYIWIGINVDEDLFELRQEVKRIENIINFSDSNLTLPMHISLKMSFWIDNGLYDEVVKDISNIINSWKPFEIIPKGIELDNTISWVMMNKNESLNEIHDYLNKFFMKKYAVPSFTEASKCGDDSFYRKWSWKK